MYDYLQQNELYIYQYPGFNKSFHKYRFVEGLSKVCRRFVEVDRFVEVN